MQTLNQKIVRADIVTQTTQGAPPTSQAFFQVAAAGSWQAVIERSGHTQFLSAGRLLDPLLRLLCPGGSGSPNEVPLYSSQGQQ